MEALSTFSINIKRSLRNIVLENYLHFKKLYYSRSFANNTYSAYLFEITVYSVCSECHTVGMN